jgi:endonuclease YncB( thermonuclease family)
MARFFAAGIKPFAGITKILDRLARRRGLALWLLALLSTAVHLTGSHAAGTFSIIGSGRSVGSLMKVRLHCIDAPELAQAPYGPAARDKLRGLLAGRAVTVKAEKTDKYGRTVGDVMLAGGESVELALVRGGYAAVYRKYCTDTRYDAAENEAKAARRGIWARTGEQQTPWAFRHGG